MDTQTSFAAVDQPQPIGADIEHMSPLAGSSRSSALVHSNEKQANLPFLQLSRMFQSLRLSALPHNLDQTHMEIENDVAGEVPGSTELALLGLPDHTAGSAMLVEGFQEIRAKHEHTVLPVLKALLPRSVIFQRPCISLEQLSKNQFDFLTYALTNNLAGLDKPVPLDMIYSYLKEPICRLLDPGSKSLCPKDILHSIPSLKPLLEIFFRCAVEAGDSLAVRSILLYADIGIGANDQVCEVGGRQFTPIERSSQLQHLALTRVLIEFGADTNKTYRPRWMTELDIHINDPTSFLHGALHLTPQGALEWAIAEYNNDRENQLKLARLLIDAGAVIGLRALCCCLDKKAVDFIELLLHLRLQDCYRTWAKNGFLHAAFEIVGRDALSAALKSLLTVNLNFDESEKGEGVMKSARRKRPPKIIDTLALRGDLSLLHMLRQYGASLTDDVLVAAVRGDNELAVQYLLEEGADPNGFSPHFCATPFSEAVRLQSFNMIRLLELCSSPLESIDRPQLCAMMAAAAEAGQVSLVKSLVALNKANQFELGFALSKAVAKDETHISILLLETGASMNQDQIGSVFKKFENEPRSGFSPYHSKSDFLMNALSNRNRILVHQLLEHGACVDSSMPFDVRDWLKAAVEWGDREIINSMIAVGAASGSGEMAIAIAARNGAKDLIGHLLDAGIGIDEYRSNHKPTLWHILKDIKEEKYNINTTQMIRELLAEGAETADYDVLVEAMEMPVNPPIFYMIFDEFRKRYPRGVRGIGEGALCYAINRGYDDLVEYMLNGKGINRVLQPTFSGAGKIVDETPLAAGIRKDSGSDLNLVRRMLDFGFAPNSIVSKMSDVEPTGDISSARETALLVAIETRQPAMVQLLLQHDANVNSPAVNGVKRTPLQKAAEVGCFAVVELLLEHGAEVNALPAVRSGATAFQLAAFRGFYGIAELLLDWGADAAAAGAKVNGRTALEGASEHGRSEMVAFLTGLLGPQDSSYYDTAIRLARSNGHSYIAAFLESASVDEVQNVLIEEPECYTCRSCGMTLSNKWTLQRHERDIHGNKGERPKFKCDVCSKVLSRQDVLDRHKLGHEGRSSSQCLHCKKSFRRKDYLKSHEKGCRRRLSKRNKS